MIDLCSASKHYLQVATPGDNVHICLILHQSLRESRRVCPWIPRLRHVPRKCSRGVRLPAQQHERLHSRQQRRRRGLVSYRPCQFYLRYTPQGLRTAAAPQGCTVFFYLSGTWTRDTDACRTSSSRSCVPAGMSPDLLLVFMGWAAFCP